MCGRWGVKGGRSGVRCLGCVRSYYCSVFGNFSVRFCGLNAWYYLLYLFIILDKIILSYLFQLIAITVTSPRNFLTLI